LIPDIISQIPVDAKQASIALGNTAPRRDYIHADDTARGIAALALEARDTPYEIYNIATGVDFSVSELVEMLGTVMGIKIAITTDETRKRRIDRPSQLGNAKKLQSELGIVPQKTLRTALEDIVMHSGRPLAKAT
jgi:UDP-glucose 4-epimerase